MQFADMFLAKLRPCLNQRLSAWCFVERPPFQRSFLCWRVAQPWDEDWCRGFRSCHSARCHRPEPPASARVHRDRQSHPSRSGSPRTEDLAAFLSARHSQPAAPNATSHLQRHGTKLQHRRPSLLSEPSPEPSQHPSLLWGLMVRCVSAKPPAMLAAQDGAAPTQRFCCSCSPSPNGVPRLWRSLKTQPKATFQHISLMEGCFHTRSSQVARFRRSNRWNKRTSSSLQGSGSIKDGEWNIDISMPRCFV